MLLETRLVDQPDAGLVQPEEVLDETPEVDSAVRDIEEGESSAVAANVGNLVSIAVRTRSTTLKDAPHNWNSASVTSMGS